MREGRKWSGEKGKCREGRKWLGEKGRYREGGKEMVRREGQV